jgi:hypothetical protein
VMDNKNKKEKKNDNSKKILRRMVRTM